MARVLGIDLGGTGSRVVLAPAEPSDGGSRMLHGERAAVTGSGSTVPDVAGAAVRAALDEWPDARDDLAAIAVGATGLATLVPEPDAMRTAIAATAGIAEAAVTVAGDLVTTHLGALGGQAGAVVAVGTGSIALGTDFASTWQRVDGWGHLVGDRGAGVWIGIQALQVAAAAHDGRSSHGAALLGAARKRFGATETWPSQLYTQQDRAGVLASFAPEVAALAADGDAAAVEIMSTAGAHVATTLAAALVSGVPAVASYAGGVFEAGGVFTESFERSFRELRPDAELRAPQGAPVDGVVTLARMTARAQLHRRPGFVWCAQSAT
ncbi:BadF/BadG/BcrA/BcrD ATPase family protein [Microbacterium sp. BWT-B31]|uniref:N-acetylglucosamine kinase n=1 Tax=Microbacterium sp. BWT-B31 TaxID=3232072 RepID=UPI003526D404